MIPNCNFSLKDVHELSKKNTIDSTAERLKITTRILKRFIARFAFPDAEGKEYILTYNTLSSWALTTPTHPFWQKYDEINGGEKRNFTEMTLRQVHAIFQQSKSFEDGANALNLWSETLYRWVTNKDSSKANWNDLNFDKLRQLSEKDAENRFGEVYDQKVQLPAFKLNNHSLNKIHLTLLQKGTLRDTALELNVETEELNSFLKIFINERDKPLTTASLLKMKEYKARLWFEEQYDTQIQPIIIKKALSEYNLKELHEIIIKYSVNSAASVIGVTDSELKQHIARFTFTNNDELLQFLTVDILNAITVEDASKIFKDEYIKQNGGVEHLFEKYTLEQLHQLCKTTNSIAELARSFNMRANIIADLLTHRTIKGSDGNNITLSFDYLKNLSIADGKRILREHYDDAMDSLQDQLNPLVPKLSEFSLSILNSNKRVKLYNKNTDTNLNTVPISTPLNDKDEDEDEVDPEAFLQSIFLPMSQ